MATKVQHLNIDPEVKKALRDVAVDLDALKSKVNNIVTDIGTLNTVLDALVAKLNADAGVTDTDYASIGTPATSGAVSLQTSES